LEKKTIKCAVLGLGFIGKKHIAIIQQTQGLELVALCDVCERNEAKIAEDLVNIPYYQGLTSLLKAQKEVDLLCICTPNGMHATQSIEALKAGKNIVCEKPMALNSRDCQRMLKAAEQSGKQIFLMMQNRYSPIIQWLKNLVEEKTLGDIYTVQINCFWNRDDRYYKPNPTTSKPSGWHGTKNLDGGPLFTQFSHFIDLLYWCFGDIEKVKKLHSNFAHQNSTEFSDTGIISFQFKKGGIGSFQYSTAVWNQNFESTISIIAQNGTLKIGGQYMDKLEYCSIKDYNPDFQENKENKSNLALFFNDIVDNLKHGKAFIISPEDGLEVVKIIEKWN
jgi:UDP-N-acetyl-2-amino-2-deoxyglucuronate dehydrogenase